MRTSIVLMRRVNRELTVGAVLWFGWGLLNVLARLLGNESLKADKNAGLVWLMFGTMLALGKIVSDCAEAIVVAVGEKERQKEHDDEFADPPSTAVS
jgi:hypothetical protein